MKGEAKESCEVSACVHLHCMYIYQGANMYTCMTKAQHTV